jgi:hypothetical protein
VFALLKSKRWATSLVAGESGSSLSCASFFYCRVELTEEGLRHVPEIGEIVFRWGQGDTPCTGNSIRRCLRLRAAAFLSLSFLSRASSLVVFIHQANIHSCQLVASLKLTMMCGPPPLCLVTGTLLWCGQEAYGVMCMRRWRHCSASGSTSGTNR